MNVWQMYVLRVVLDDNPDVTQGEIAERSGVTQTTVGRWLNGTKVPIEAANVASFAKGYGRNVLEAFIAAGMLTETEAKSGLDEVSAGYLRKVRRLAADPATEGWSNMASRRPRKRRM